LDISLEVSNYKKIKQGGDYFYNNQHTVKNSISLLPRFTTTTNIAEICYWGILRYNQKLKVTAISQEKPKLHPK
jgi:hypothetical protein